MQTTILAFSSFLFIGLGLVTASEYKAAVSTAVITPTEPTWLGGYGSRTEPADGKVHDLNAKVLVIEDSGGYRLALLTIDTENVPRAFGDQVAKELHDRYKLAREQVIISSSHTHSGPGLASPDARIIYPMTRDQYAVTERYTAWLARRLVELTGETLDKLAPAELSYGIGQCGFGVNRRTNKEAQTTQPSFTPVGPVDHDVPVLRITRGDKIEAVVISYACHNTTMNFQQWCGDWAGFAKLDIEANHPGTTALFVTGCGADTNPLPRRKIELCRKYGQELADATEKVLAEPMRPIHGPLRAQLKQVDLAFQSVPSHQDLEKAVAGTNVYQKRWAQYLLEHIADGQPLSPTYPYLVQAARLGDDINMVVLSGEVVVDYSLRLKKELGPNTLVFAYCNDVCAYMPSERVLKEGGYEGGEAMTYYGLPSPWATGLEDKIVKAVREMVDALHKSPSR